jgi:hypothetical protein
MHVAEVIRMVKAMRELKPNGDELQLINNERDKHERPDTLYLECLSRNDNTLDHHQQLHQQQQPGEQRQVNEESGVSSSSSSSNSWTQHHNNQPLAPPQLAAGATFSKVTTLVDLATNVSMEMAVQEIAPDDECTVSAIGNQPSAVSNGSEATQVLPPDDVPAVTSRDQRVWHIGTNPLSLLKLIESTASAANDSRTSASSDLLNLLDTSDGQQQLRSEQRQSTARVADESHTTRSRDLQLTPLEPDHDQPTASSDGQPRPISTSPTVRTAQWLKQKKKKKRTASSPTASPYRTSNITVAYADTVPALNRCMDSLASIFDWIAWGEKNNCYRIGDDQVNLVKSKESTAASESDSSVDDTDLPQGALKDLRRATMLKMPHEQRKKFLAAKNKELKAIEDLEFIEGMVPIPRGVRPINTRYVYSVKDPVIQEGLQTDPIAKARLAMKYIKQGGDNLRATFAPTGQAATFRWLMMIAMILKLLCDHVDFNTVFLYTTLTTPMYIKGAPGRLCPPGFWLKVVKALYGCRTAPQGWLHFSLSSPERLLHQGIEEFWTLVQHVLYSEENSTTG